MIKNQKKINLFIFALIILLFLEVFPYFNLVFSFLTIIVIFYVVFILLFKIPSKISLLIGLLLILFSFPWLLAGSRVRVEALGVLGFISLSLGLIQEAISIRKK